MFLYNLVLKKMELILTKRWTVLNLFKGEPVLHFSVIKAIYALYSSTSCSVYNNKLIYNNYKQHHTSL